MEWLTWKLDQIMVLHRRSSKLSNVLYFLNTPNLPLPGPVGWWRFLYLSRWDIEQKFQGSKSPVSWESANGCLQPWNEVQRAWLSHIHGDHWMSSAESNQRSESPQCQPAEETRAKQTPGHECAWTHSALLYTEAQPLRRQHYLLNTDTHFLCAFLPPPKNKQSPSVSTQTCK